MRELITTLSVSNLTYEEFLINLQNVQILLKKFSPKYFPAIVISDKYFPVVFFQAPVPGGRRLQRRLLGLRLPHLPPHLAGRHPR